MTRQRQNSDASIRRENRGDKHRHAGVDPPAPDQNKDVTFRTPVHARPVPNVMHAIFTGLQNSTSLGHAQRRAAKMQKKSRECAERQKHQGPDPDAATPQTAFG